MSYDIELSQLFQDQFRLLPKGQERLVQGKVDVLKHDPRPNAKNKKALVGSKDPKRFRIRAGKYRVIYSFTGDMVHLWNVDDRDEVYVKNTEKGYVPIPITDDGDSLDDSDVEVQDIEPSTPRTRDYYRQQICEWSQQGQPEPQAASVTDEPYAGSEPTRPKPSPTPLPKPVTVTLLRRMRIPRRYYLALTACTTDADLVTAVTDHDVPGDVVSRVFDQVAEPDLVNVIYQPRKQIKEVEDLQRFYDHDVIDLQVALDPAQKQIAKTVLNSGGPWLITGAPGSGKSTVLLDIALDMYRDATQEGREPRILFTTFTNALVATTEKLLDRIHPGPRPRFNVRTTDSVVAELMEKAGETWTRKENETLQGLLRPVVQKIYQEQYVQRSLLDHDRQNHSLHGTVIGMEPLTNMTWKYLLEEIEEVIVGRDMSEQEDYLTEPRAGRRVSLGDVQRDRVWDISNAFTRELSRRGWTSYARRRQRVAKLLSEGQLQDRYDAVFVDEAQDLQPNVIRMLVELARSDDGTVRDLYLSADGNQTIYGSSYSWISIHPDLRLQGRTRRLNTNHRSTRQIVDAAASYLSGAELESERGALEHRN
ncbi:MAG: putative DNA helicase, partial [uncultured Chloroflexia bacterium]